MVCLSAILHTAEAVGGISGMLTISNRATSTGDMFYQVPSFPKTFNSLSYLPGIKISWLRNSYSILAYICHNGFEHAQLQEVVRGNTEIKSGKQITDFERTYSLKCLTKIIRQTHGGRLTIKASELIEDNDCSGSEIGVLAHLGQIQLVGKYSCISRKESLLKIVADIPIKLDEVLEGKTALYLGGTHASYYVTEINGEVLIVRRAPFSDVYHVEYSNQEHLVVGNLIIDLFARWAEYKNNPPIFEVKGRIRVGCLCSDEGTAKTLERVVIEE